MSVTPAEAKASAEEPSTAAVSSVARDALSWFASNARDLPWRGAGTTAWAVMVSEFMLQQTPVDRVVQPYQAWMNRWPTAAALAADPVADAIRAWGRLGYPRRAVRLHASARDIVDRFGGEVPSALEDLRSLPGVGEYTASAIAAFAFGQQVAVLDTNVRRVLGRVFDSHALPLASSISARDRALATRLIAAQPTTRGTQVCLAVMELGAMLCTARSPSCPECPLQRNCQWRRAGSPPPAHRPRRQPGYEGTDRQCRGHLLAILRNSGHPVIADELIRSWPDRSQAERSLRSLMVDGLVAAFGDDAVGLPAG